MSSVSEAKYSLDWLKWLLVAGLLSVGIYANAEFAMTSLLVRAYGYLGGIWSWKH